MTLENKQLKDRVNELEGQLKQAQQKSPTNIADLIGNVQQAKDQELLQDLEHARAEFDMKLDEKDREIEELKKQLGELQKENDERKGENDYLKEQLLGVEQHFTDQIKELVGTMEKAKEEEIVNFISLVIGSKLFTIIDNRTSFLKTSRRKGFLSLSI